MSWFAKPSISPKLSARVKVMHKVRNLWYQVNDKTNFVVRKKVQNPVDLRIERPVWDQIKDNVWDRLGGSIEARIKRHNSTLEV